MALYSNLQQVRLVRGKEKSPCVVTFKVYVLRNGFLETCITLKNKVAVGSCKCDLVELFTATRSADVYFFITFISCEPVAGFVSPCVKTILTCNAAFLQHTDTCYSVKNLLLVTPVTVKVGPNFKV